jgi:hypothetical protein
MANCVNFEEWLQTQPTVISLAGTWSIPVIVPTAGNTVTTVELAGGVATITTATPHGYQSGQTVQVAGLTNTQFNGIYQISSVAASTFTYALAGSNFGPASDSGTVYLLITEQTNANQITSSLSAGVSSFNTRTGAVVSMAGDYTPAEVGADQVCLPTTVQTSNFNAAVGVLYPINASGGSFTGTLPNAPIDQGRITFKNVVSPGTNTFTYACSGSDVLNVAGGSASGMLTIQSQGVTLQYAHATGIWYVTSDDLPLGQLTTYLDGLFVQQSSLPLAPNLGGTGEANNAANTIGFFGAYSLAITLTAPTAVTFPTSGTLATTAEIPIGSNPTSLVGTAAINGSSTDFMREDAAPAINQAMAPTWTQLHTWSQNGIATTATDSILLENTTAATTGAPVQQSPSVHLQGQGMFIGAASGSGGTVSITASAGAITAVTATPPAGGSSYPHSATIYLLVVQSGGANGVVKATTNSSGVITAYTTTPVSAGTGYTTATGLATAISLSMATDVLTFALPVEGTTGLPTVQYQIMMQVNGGGYGTVFSINSAGPLAISSANLAVNAFTSTSAPAISLGTAGNIGQIYSTAASVLIGWNGMQCFSGQSSGVELYNNLFLSGNSGQFRQGTNAQIVSIFNTYTSGTNYECLNISWQASTNVCSIGTFMGSSGTARALELLYGGTTTPAITVPITSGPVAFAYPVNDQTGTRIGVNVVVAPGAMAALGNLGVTTTAGQTIVGTIVIPSQNSVAAGGLQFDLNGGSATFTSLEFGFAGTPVGCTLGASDSNAASVPLTITSASTTASWVTIQFSAVVNAAGTIIPRGGPLSPTTGTAQFNLAGFMTVKATTN